MADMDAKILGLSPGSLQRLGETLQRRVEEKIIPGAVIALGRRGKLAILEAFGFRDREAKVSMRTDSIFRIASMTKPARRGKKLNLESPISDYLPVMNNLKVARETAANSLQLVPAEREPTILDLLRHTSGFTHDIYGDRPVKHLYRGAGLRSVRNATEFLAKLAELPLQSQPGSDGAMAFPPI